MRVLLTGGTGLLGRSLQRVVAARCAEWELDAIGRANLDLCDQRAVRSWFESRRYDLVIHAAATVGGIRANIAHPTMFLAQNTLMNTLVIEEARRSGVRNLLFLGSSCMYPKDLGRLLGEDTMLTAPLEPTNEGYALAKILSTRHCEAIAKEYGLAYRTVVPCNLYGPDDHFDEERSHLVASALFKLNRAKVKGIESVIIWGDGQARREFLFVDDLADFIVSNGDRIDSLPSMINVGVGLDHSVNEYYALAAEVVGFTGRFEHDLSAPVGMQRKLMDVSLAGSLGWMAKTQLLDGMRSAYYGMLAQLERSSGGFQL